MTSNTTSAKDASAGAPPVIVVSVRNPELPAIARWALSPTEVAQLYKVLGDWLELSG